MSLPINIEELLHGKVIEWERLEFKQDWNPEPTMHTLCAFANDLHNWGGGYVIVGVAEEKGRPVLPPSGISPNRIDGIQKELTQISHRIQPHYLPIVQPHLYEGKHILIIWAPAGDARPYSAPGSLAKGRQQRFHYLRSGSKTIKAQGETLRQLQQLAARIPFDDRINPQATVNDLDLGLIRDFLHEIKSTLAEESASMPFADLARQLAIAKGPEEELRPVNAGLMFFHREPEKFFRNAWIEVVIRQDEAGKNFSEKYFKGPLHHQLREALGYLRNQIIEERVKKIPGRAEADRFYNFPHDALEEALANAVYHKSYELPNPIEVQVWPDRIEILSFPGPIPPVDAQILAENRRIVARDYRNRRLGDFLKELHLTEGRGTGIPTMRKAMKENGSPEPALDTNEQCTYFLTTLHVHPDWVDHESDDRGSTDQVPTKYRPSVEEAEKDDPGKPITEHVLNKHWTSGEQVSEKLAELIKSIEGEKTRSALQEMVNIKSRRYFIEAYLNPGIEQGFMEMTIPAKPQSSKQRYRLTEKGRALKKELLEPKY